MAKAVTPRRPRGGSAGTGGRGGAGPGQPRPGGLVEDGGGGRGGDGDFGGGGGGGRRFRPPFDLAGMLVDGLSAASGLLGLAGDGAVATGEDGGGVADPGA